MISVNKDVGKNVKIGVKEKSKLSNNEYIYVIEIIYNCLYGGDIVQYEFKINIEDCGTAAMYWTKVCGDPLCILLLLYFFFFLSFVLYFYYYYYYYYFFFFVERRDGFTVKS